MSQKEEKRTANKNYLKKIDSHHFFQMKYLAAYLLAKLGKENSSIDDIKRIVKSVGIEFDEKKAKEIIQKLEGKDINEVIYDGKSKLTVISNPRSVNDNQQPTGEQQQEENKENKGYEEEEESLEDSTEIGNDIGEFFINKKIVNFFNGVTEFLESV